MAGSVGGERQHEVRAARHGCSLAPEVPDERSAELVLCSVELDRRINALRRLAPGAVERLEDDPDSAAMVERHLQVAIQAAIGVAAWAIADRCRRQPDSDADTFYVLAEEGLQDRPAAFRFADMAGHQNVLVRACPKANQATKARHATEGLSGLTELAVRCGAQVGGRRP